MRSAKEILHSWEKNQLPIYQMMLDEEIKETETSEEKIRQRLLDSWQVMRLSATRPLTEDDWHGVIIGGEGKKVWEHYQAGKGVAGGTITRASAYALSATITNAAMGKIVAAPTAGACGVLPAVLLSLQDDIGFDDQTAVNGLLTAGGVGQIIACSAGISGAQCGCQAEVGSASAMAAAAVVEIMDGTVPMALDAAAIAIKNVLGLACDPVAGLVECPCSKRNVMGAANAFVAAELALAGVVSHIPLDEVLEAMRQVGSLMPAALRETAKGGLAATPTGEHWSQKLAAERGLS